jgi:hypothetical protein
MFSLQLLHINTKYDIPVFATVLQKWYIHAWCQQTTSPGENLHSITKMHYMTKTLPAINRKHHLKTPALYQCDCIT